MIGGELTVDEKSSEWNRIGKGMRCANISEYDVRGYKTNLITYLFVLFGFLWLQSITSHQKYTRN